MLPNSVPIDRVGWLARNVITLSNQVRYYGAKARTEGSVAVNAMPWVSGIWGGNQETGLAHGGWSVSAVDYARVLASFDRKEPENRLLPTWMTSKMWGMEPNAAPGTLRGWFAFNLIDENGVVQPAVQHNGAGPGARSLVVRREDGLSFVLFFNCGLPDWGLDSYGNDNSSTGLNGGLYGAYHGWALNEIANRVTRANAWSDDLFPQVGIPSFLPLVSDGISPELGVGVSPGTGPEP